MKSVEDRVLEMVRQGFTYTHACRVVNIPPSQFPDSEKLRQAREESIERTLAKVRTFGS